ncbi:MAG: hypothetical protein AAF602_28775, partial [Myxococcota bacterium]
MEPPLDNPAVDPASWYEQAIDDAIAWSAALHLGTSTTFLLVTLAAAPQVVALPLLFGGVLWLVRGRGPAALRISILLGVYALDQAAVGLQVAWAPGEVAIGLLFAIFAGLFLGWRGVGLV